MSPGKKLVIDRLGHDGDGIAQSEGHAIYVPWTLPGETVVVDVAGERGRLIRVETPSPERQSAPCSHFATCGGCALQHLASAPYLAFKRQLVVDAFRDRGLMPEVGEVVPIAPGTRRRVVFSAVRGRTGVQLGFYGARGSDIVPIQACTVASPAIVKALPALARLAESLVSRRGEVRLAVTAADNGLDVAISGAKGKLNGAARLKLVEAAGAGRFLRVTLGGDPVLALAEPVVDFDGIKVALPPGGFLQAARESEGELRRHIVAAAAGAKRVVDLFAGLGTFSLPLSRRAEVMAVEGDKAATTALSAAHGRTPGLKPLKALTRDLFRDPLSAQELDTFDAAVLDPPRQGAMAQAEAITKSKVPVVVAVSCNPATLARDVRILVDGGYTLGGVTPVDQFLYSAHVELVAVLRR